MECAALVRAIKQGDLDRLMIPEAPLDVLAQQIVAACAAGNSASVGTGTVRGQDGPGDQAGEGAGATSDDGWDEEAMFALASEARLSHTGI